MLYQQEDEESFIVSPALLEQLGAAGNEISLGDLLAGMDRIANEGSESDLGSSEELNDLVRTTIHSAAQRRGKSESARAPDNCHLISWLLSSPKMVTWLLIICLHAIHVCDFE